MKQLRALPRYAVAVRACALAVPLIMVSTAGLGHYRQSLMASKDPAATYKTRDYIFPLQVGDRVVMAMTHAAATSSGSPEPAEVIDVITIGNQHGFVVKRSDITEFVTAEASGVTVSYLPKDQPQNTQSRTNTPIKPERAYPAVLRTGDTFIAYDTSDTRLETGFSGSSVTVTDRRQVIGTVEGMDNVATRAGTFKNCLRIKIETVLTQATGASEPTTDLRLVTYEWYAPGIGLVRAQDIDSSGATSSSHDLLAYEVRGHTTKPGKS